MTYELANGSPMIFDLTGSANGDATCMLQRVLRSVNLTLDLSDSGALVKRKRDEMVTLIPFFCFFSLLH